MTSIPKPARRGPKPKARLRRTAPPARKSRPRTRAKAGKARMPARKFLAHVADELSSLYVRSRRVCEIRCAGRPFAVADLQWAHGWSRSWWSLRYDPRNSFASCRGCHKFYTHRPALWVEWLQDRLGMDLYRQMRDIAASHAKPNLAGIIRRLWPTPEVQGALAECSEAKRVRLGREVDRVLRVPPAGSEEA